MSKFLLSAFAAALGYYLLGRFGLMLAIPPGFASSVWPASGFALAMALRFPLFPVILGIGVGSLVLNLGVSTQNFSQWDQLILMVPLGICLGAMLQAMAGRALYRMLVGEQPVPDTTSGILALLLIVGPIGCIVAASFGAGSLLWHGIIPGDAYTFTWLTWWIGDTIGVLLFTPLILVGLSDSNRLSRLRKLQVILPSLLVFVGILFVFFTSKDRHQQLLEKDFEDAANRWLVSIERRLDLALSKVEAYEAFFAASEFVSDEEFDIYSRNLVHDDPAIQAVGWTRIIPKAERVQAERSMRDAGYPNFEFTEMQSAGSVIRAPDREQYYPVLYISPYEGNEFAHGLNLGANSVRLKALTKARERGITVATAPITLVQETRNQKGFIVYFPIYRQGTERIPSNFMGYISGVFRAEGMLSGILMNAENEGFGIELVDRTDADAPINLLQTTSPANQLFSPVSSSLAFGERDYELEVFPIAGRFFAERDWVSWYVMTAGVLFAALLQSLILIITGSLSSVENKVRQKTRDLREALQVAERASLAKSNFLSNISHELRTPLNAIIGLLRMSRQTKLQPPVDEYLDKAALASDTLLGLINQTLDFHKIESGKIELESTPFELMALLQKIEAIFSTQAEEKKLRFGLNLPPELPQNLIGDSLRLEQILLNFCGNAFKFTPEGEITLSVELKDRSDLKCILAFVVEDTGIGIPQDQQQALFEPFQQADASMTRKYGGTGLGLAINKRLVELMGGEITFKSTEGKGSWFRITLAFPLTVDTPWLSTDAFKSSIARREFSPSDTVADARESLQTESALTQQSEGQAPAAEESEHHSEAALKRGELAGIRILLVEDVAVNQLIAKHMLETHGAEVEVANHGKEALDILQESPNYDLVLMDIQMPEMDGYQATREIRKRWDVNDLPVVAMTANAMEPEVQACLDCGMNSHIAKPIEEKDVLAKLRPFIRRH